jgi:hypothetical protein
VGKKISLDINEGKIISMLIGNQKKNEEKVACFE